MAESFSATALRGHVLHTPRGFLVFNEGKETSRIPEDLRAVLVRDGVIAGSGDEGGRAAPASDRKPPARRRGSRKAAAAGAPADFDAGAFTVTKADGIGMYAISGPGLAAPETVKGKAKVQGRLDELNKAAASGAKSDAPAE